MISKYQLLLFWHEELTLISINRWFGELTLQRLPNKQVRGVLRGRCCTGLRSRRVAETASDAFLPAAGERHSF